MAIQNRKQSRTGIRFVTPEQRHLKLDEAILIERAKVYAAARDAHPNRWSGATRNWSPITQVHEKLREYSEESGSNSAGNT